jgi:hypothetical protein
MADNHEQIRRKVDFPVFVWVITILSSVMLTISGYLFTELADNRASIRELTAKLEAEKDKNISILVTLAEIKGNVQNIKDKVDQQVIRR